MTAGCTPQYSQRAHGTSPRDPPGGASWPAPFCSTCHVRPVLNLPLPLVHGEASARSSLRSPEPRLPGPWKPGCAATTMDQHSIAFNYRGRDRDLYQSYRDSVPLSERVSLVRYSRLSDHFVLQIRCAGRWHEPMATPSAALRACSLCRLQFDTQFCQSAVAINLVASETCIEWPEATCRLDGGNSGGMMWTTDRESWVQHVTE